VSDKAGCSAAQSRRAHPVVLAAAGDAAPTPILPRQPYGCDRPHHEAHPQTGGRDRNLSDVLFSIVAVLIDRLRSLMRKQIGFGVVEEPGGPSASSILTLTRDLLELNQAAVQNLRRLIRRKLLRVEPFRPE
jgi:hypothetical protein